MLRVKVAVIHNTIAPYRHPLFEKLSQNVDLTVYYCSAKCSLRSWNLWPRNYDYKYKILPRIPVGESSTNLLIIKELILNRPDVLVLSGYVDPTIWLAFAVGKLLKIPIIYWTEGIREPRSILGIITRPLRMLFVEKSDAIVVPGMMSWNYVISLRANREKVFVAPNAIDNELFMEKSCDCKLHKDEIRRRLGLKDKVVILCISQFIKRKGIEYLLLAHAKLERELDNIALVLIGSGPLESRLKDPAKSLKLKDVKFVRSGLSLRELIRFYCTADVFVLPTIEDLWGFVVNEAMACGLPVIATQASQAAVEMVQHGENGYIIKEADVEELYKTLKKMACDAGLRKRTGKRSSEIVISEFSVKRMSDGFIDAINYCLSLLTSEKSQV